MLVALGTSRPCVYWLRQVGRGFSPVEFVRPPTIAPPLW